jgi:hypothetical protein
MLGEVYTGGKVRRFEAANLCGFGNGPGAGPDLSGVHYLGSPSARRIGVYQPTVA